MKAFKSDASSYLYPSNGTNKKQLIYIYIFVIAPNFLSISLIPEINKKLKAMTEVNNKLGVITKI